MVTTHQVSRLVENCAERLEEGRAANYRGVNLWLAPDHHLEVRVHRSWRVEGAPDEELPDDLEFARCAVGELCSKSSHAARLIETLPWRLVRLNEAETGATSVWCPETGKSWWSVPLY